MNDFRETLSAWLQGQTHKQAASRLGITLRRLESWLYEARRPEPIVEAEMRRRMQFPVVPATGQPITQEQIDQSQENGQ